MKKKLSILFLFLIAFSLGEAQWGMGGSDVADEEYPGAQREYMLGYNAGRQGKPDPCVFAGLICSDAYNYGREEYRVEKRYIAKARREEAQSAQGLKKQPESSLA